MEGTISMLKSRIITTAAAIFFLTGLVAANESQAESFIGAEYDAAIISRSADNSDTTIALKKIDLFFHFKADKTKAYVQLDLLNPKWTSTAADTDVANTNKAFDDAWIQYGFNDSLQLKIGIEEAYQILRGINTELRKGIGLDKRQGIPKIELSGNFETGMYYGLLLWEDVPQDLSASDKDGAIGSNISTKFGYRTENIDTGLIYVNDQGYTNGATTVKDATGFSLYLRYKRDNYGVYAKIGRREITDDQKGGDMTILGGQYYVNETVSALIALTIHKEAEAKTGQGSQQTIIDIATKFRMNNNQNFFIQYLSESKYRNSAGTDIKAAGEIAIGTEGRF